MRYQVPQFIEVEDKIFGPLTFRQFVYIAGGAGMGFVAYKLLPFILALPVGLAVIGFGLALAFYKVNNKPFIDVVESAITYFLGNKLYIWHKVDKKPTSTASTSAAPVGAAGVLVPKLSDSRLKDLTWSLDINETLYSKDANKLTSGNTLETKL